MRRSGCLLQSLKCGGLFSPCRFAPDWVLKKDKLKDVVDPLRAIKMLANTLSIVL